MSTLILNSLEVRNFRAFRDLKIERRQYICMPAEPQRQHSSGKS